MNSILGSKGIGREKDYSEIPVQAKGNQNYESSKQGRKLLNKKTELNLAKLLSKLIDKTGSQGGGIYISIVQNQPIIQIGDAYNQLDLNRTEEAELTQGRCLIFDNLYVKAIQVIGDVTVFLGLKIKREHITDEVKHQVKLSANLMNEAFDLATRELLLTHYSEMLNKQKVQLERVQNYNKHVLSITTHDLSSPLNAISGYLDLMNECLHSDRDIDRIDKYHNQIKVGVSNLHDMISQLTEVVHLENNKEEPTFIKLDLSWVVNEVTGLLKSMAEKKGHSLLLSLPDEPVFIKGDLTKLKRILFNLVSNAIKYTPTYGVIRITVFDNDKGAGVSVSDNGIGISEPDQKLVFDAFKKVHNPEIKSKHSFGLGLYISSVFAKMMNAGLSLKSKLGKGSVFTLTFEESVADMIEVSSKQAC